MSNLVEADVFAGLTSIRRGLAADGYRLELDVADRIVVTIVAGPDACEDCLVGKSVMQGIVVDALRDFDLELADGDVEVRYPGE